MHSVRDAPHTEQRCFAFPIPANDNAPSTAIYRSRRYDAISHAGVEIV
jgi:hypothetical protein